MMGLLAAALMTVAEAAPTEQITLENAITVFDLGLAGANAAVTVAINADKTAKGECTNFGTTYSGVWLIPADADPADYEVEFHVNSGDPMTSGTVDSWLGLGSNRTVSLARTVDGTYTSELRIQIRRASDMVVVKSVVWYLTASKEP